MTSDQSQLVTYNPITDDASSDIVHTIILLIGVLFIIPIFLYLMSYLYLSCPWIFFKWIILLIIIILLDLMNHLVLFRIVKVGLWLGLAIAVGVLLTSSIWTPCIFLYPPLVWHLFHRSPHHPSQSGIIDLVTFVGLTCPHWYIKAT
jgi:signal transduction histidine kinase